MKIIKSILTTVMILATVSMFGQKMKVDTEKSSLQWHGEKVTGEHFGQIDLKEGWLHWDNNKIN